MCPWIVFAIDNKRNMWDFMAFWFCVAGAYERNCHQSRKYLKILSVRSHQSRHSCQGPAGMVGEDPRKGRSEFARLSGLKQKHQFRHRFHLRPERCFIRCQAG